VDKSYHQQGIKVPLLLVWVSVVAASLLSLLAATDANGSHDLTRVNKET
jgi:hypothetical protein